MRALRPPPKYYKLILICTIRVVVVLICRAQVSHHVHKIYSPYWIDSFCPLPLVHIVVLWWGVVIYTTIYSWCNSARHKSPKCLPGNYGSFHKEHAAIVWWLKTSVDVPARTHRKKIIVSFASYCEYCLHCSWLCANTRYWWLISRRLKKLLRK